MKNRGTHKRLRSWARALHVALVMIGPGLLLAPMAAADDDPAGAPFQALDKRLTTIEAVIPPLAEGLQALQNFVAPEQFVVPSGTPCPEGYVKATIGFGISLDKCVPASVPPPPLAPTACEDGYEQKATLRDGSPVPQHLLVCELVGDNSATVYVTFRNARMELQDLRAQCPESFVVTGGGYSSLDVESGRIVSVSKNLLVYSSRPVPPDQWSISVKFSDVLFHDVTVHAVCIAGPAS